jgi:hypothetical protein
MTSPGLQGVTNTAASAANPTAPVSAAANAVTPQNIAATGNPGSVIQSTGAVQPGAGGTLQAPPNTVPGQMSASSANPGSQMSSANQAQLVNMPATPSNDAGQTSGGVSMSPQNNGMFSSISNWVNNNQALALKLGIAGGGGLLAAGASMLGPHSKSPLQSSQYTAHMPAVNPNYQQLLGNASKGYQSTPQFAGYNPVSSVTSANGPYNFYNPSMNTG